MERNYSVGKKILYIFLGFLALPAAELLQLLISIPAAMVMIAQSAAESPGSWQRIIERFLIHIKDGSLNDSVSLIYSAAAVAGFGIWFILVFRKDHGPLIRGRHFSIGVLVGIIVFVIGLQFLCNLVVMGTEALLPGAMEEYKEMTEMAGFNEPSTAIYIYGIILGPIAEELIFRGVMLHYFKRSMPFFLANLLHAVFFGIYHLNVIQGVYAFVMGLFFAGMMETGHSIFYSLLAHMSFNFFGFTEILDFGSDTRLYYYLWMPVMVLCLVLGLILFFEKLNGKNRECREIPLKGNLPPADI